MQSQSHKVTRGLILTHSDPCVDEQHDFGVQGLRIILERPRLRAQILFKVTRHAHGSILLRHLDHGTMGKGTAVRTSLGVHI